LFIQSFQGDARALPELPELPEGCRVVAMRASSLTLKSAFESAAPEVADAAFVVHHRQHRKHARWHAVGHASTFAAAMLMIDGRGDWRVESVSNSIARGA
jgi:hypothetical protein